MKRGYGMVKKILPFFIICLLMTSCASRKNAVEGYWMNENGETITFNADGEAIVDNLSIKYSVFDNDKLTISKLGFFFR
jgi:hypothetical protein